MRNFFWLLKREFRLFFADRTLLSVFLLAPIIYALLFGAVYKSGKVEKLPIIVVDQDNTPTSNQLIDMLGDNEKLSIASILYNNVGTQQQMIDHKAVAVVVLPERFEAGLLQKKYPEVNVYVNTTNLLTANMASQGIQVSLGTFSAGVSIQGLKKKGMSNEEAMTQYEPFKANYIRLFNETGNYFTYMWPGVLAVVLQQVLLLGLAVSFSREYENGTFRSELLTHSRSAFELTLVKVLPFWILSIVILAAYYVFHILFHAPKPAPLVNFAITTSVFIAATTFLGVLISALLPSSLKATQVLMLMATPAFIIGGYSWPLESMPLGVRCLANILPLTPFLNAHKVMLFEKGSLASVMPSLEHLTWLMVVYGGLAFIVVKVKMVRANRAIKRPTAG